MEVQVIDLLDDAIQADPFPTYTRLLSKAPVARCEPGGVWAISRYSDVQYALKHPELFSSSGFKEMYRPSWLAEDCLRDPFILGQDPPVHNLHRPLVNRAFLPRIINGLEPLMRQTAQKLIARLKSKGAGEFIADYSYPYTGQLIGQLVGTGESQNITELREWLELLECMSPVAPSDETRCQTEAAIRRQNSYFDAVIRDRIRTPRDDLATKIVQSEIDGARLDDQTLRSALDLLITAGLGTTNYTLCNAMIVLAKQPELWRALKSDKALIPSFIEEILRFDPSTHCLLRKTVRPVEIGNVTIPENALVAVLLAAANRDPSRFDDPDTFRLSRTNAREHLAFGFGIHACIGAALARLELTVALETITAEIDQFSIPLGSLAWISSLTTHGVAELPIKLH